MTERLPFFVYGTLRPGAGNYLWTFAGHTTHETAGQVLGAVLHDNGAFPYMLLTGEPADTVTGDLLTVTDTAFSQVLTRLDRLEGYEPGATDNYYDRVVVDVHTADPDRPTRAYAYIVTGSVAHQARRLPRIDSGDWFAVATE